MLIQTDEPSRRVSPQLCGGLHGGLLGDRDKVKESAQTSQLNSVALSPPVHMFSQEAPLFFFFFLSMLKNIHRLIELQG